MTEQNAYQVADWNGQSGEYWAANQARLDAMFAVFGQAAIEAPPSRPKSCKPKARCWSTTGLNGAAHAR